MSIENTIEKVPVWKALFYYPFLFFCMFPFILGNPFAESDLQPYALVLSLLVCSININRPIHSKLYDKYFYASLVLLIVAFLVLLVSGISSSSFRGFFNYCSVFFIPLALMYVLCDFKGLPERFLKVCILIWFVVSSYQMIVDRSFATGLIANARWWDTSRGAVGLASEPSFFGIACFYMLHLANQFSVRKWVYVGLILIMGTVYAQSTLGIIFIAVFWLFLVLDQLPYRRGFIMLAVTVGLVAVFLYLLTTRLSGSRVYQLFMTMINEGAFGIEDDASVVVRYNTLWGAIAGAFNNYLVPIGFRGRVGSAYGGFLCEVGIFAIPYLICLSYVISLSFKTKVVRFFYFFAFTLLLFNNTQMGNPLLMLVIALVVFSHTRDNKSSKAAVIR